MANEIKKGISRFHLLGTAKVVDDNKNHTFTLNQKGTNNPNYIFNQANIGVDCGKDGNNIIYASLIGGYDTTKDTNLYCHGIKTVDGKQQEDFENQILVSFKDRFEERTDIAKSCYITIALNKDVNNNFIEKKFLSAYDAVAYLQENLKDGMTISVRGNLKYTQYQGKTQVKREITSIWLSTAEKADFKATFEQTVWFTQESFGEKDENGYLPLYTYVVDYYNKDVKNVCYPFQFEIDTNALSKYELIINNYLKPKNPEFVNKVVIEGRWVKTDNSTEISYEDLSEDLKQMVELGMLDEKEALGRAIGSNRGEFKTLFKSICTKKDSETNAITLLIDGENTKVEDIVKAPETTKTEEVLSQVGAQTSTTPAKKEDDTGDDGIFAELFDV